MILWGFRGGGSRELQRKGVEGSGVSGLGFRDDDEVLT